MTSGQQGFLIKQGVCSRGCVGKAMSDASHRDRWCNILGCDENILRKNWFRHFHPILAVASSQDLKDELTPGGELMLNVGRCIHHMLSAKEKRMETGFRFPFFATTYLARWHLMLHHFIAIGDTDSGMFGCDAGRALQGRRRSGLGLHQHDDEL